MLHNNGNNILKIAVVTSSKLTATPIIIKMVIDTNTISTQGQSLSVEKLKFFLRLCILGMCSSIGISFSFRFDFRIRIRPS